VPVPAQAARPLRGWPLGTVVHVPTEPVTSHDWHWPVQALSQQTKSVQ
jgi:hypothetical protein